MRNRNFLTGALVALATFIALSAFVGPRHWGWHKGWRHDHCYDDRNRNYNHDERSRPAPEKQPVTDSAYHQ